MVSRYESLKSKAMYEKFTSCGSVFGLCPDRNGAKMHSRNLLLWLSLLGCALTVLSPVTCNLQPATCN